MSLVGVRQSQLESMGDHAKVRLGASHRDARFELAEHQIRMLAYLPCFSDDVHRNPGVGIQIATSRQYADDIERRIVEKNSLSDDRGVGSEAAAPEPIA